MNILFKLFGGSYDDLWKAIIRPNKDEYTIEELGPFKFELRKKCYKRTDFELINKRSQKLMCSFWEPFDEEREKPRLPCVIYLHGNSSSRCEAYAEVKYLLQRNITVFAFDFCGCGKSEGEYISLGYYEKKDVHCVVEYLLKSNKVSKIGLWGRSMGAVTAIMYANEHPKLIDAMILDSGFYSLKTLINELIESKINLPKFIFDKVLNMVKRTVKEKAKFDMDIIEPYIYAKNCLVPAFFLHGSDDNFVLPHHCVDLFNEYKCSDKFCEIVKGSHNTSRPVDLRIKACEFLEKYLKDDDLESIGTINNENSYERVDINYNIFKNIKSKKSNINIYRNNFKNDEMKAKISKKNVTKIKNNHNNINEFLYDLNIVESKVSNENNINVNTSQNIKSYSQSKSFNNNIYLINKKKKKNKTIKRNLTINLIKKRKAEENISSSSSSNEEELNHTHNNKNIKKEPFNSFKIKSFSISQYFSNDNRPKINYNNRTPLINKSVNVVNLNKDTNRIISNLNNKSFSFLNQIIKENDPNFKNNHNNTTYFSSFLNKNNGLKFYPCSLNLCDKINEAEKTFTKNFYNPNPNKNNSTNIIQNNYFTTNNIYINKFIEVKQKKDLKQNFSYALKKSVDKYQFNNKIKDNVKNNKNKNENKKNLLLKSFDLKKQQKNKYQINYANNKENKINNKNSIPSSENTILDENEETLGKNIPH